MLWNPRNRPLIWLVYKHTPGVFFFENIYSFFELVSGGHEWRTLYVAAQYRNTWARAVQSFCLRQNIKTYFTQIS